MYFGKRALTRLCYTALLAMSLAALMPSLSLLRAARDGYGWMVVCSSLGARLVNSALADAPEGAHDVLAGEHCGYCVLQHHVPVVPGLSALAMAGLLWPRLKRVVAHYTAPYGSAPVDLRHRPRGPPALLRT